MGVSLSKGGNVSLTKEAPEPDRGHRRSGLGRPYHHRYRLRPRRQRAADERRGQGRQRRRTSSSSTTSRAPTAPSSTPVTTSPVRARATTRSDQGQPRRRPGRRRQDRLPGLDLRGREPPAELRPGAQRVHPRGEPGGRQRARPLRPHRGRLDGDRHGLRRALPATARSGSSVPSARATPRACAASRRTSASTSEPAGRPSGTRSSVRRRTSCGAAPDARRQHLCRISHTRGGQQHGRHARQGGQCLPLQGRTEPHPGAGRARLGRAFHHRAPTSTSTPARCCAAAGRVLGDE